MKSKRAATAKWIYQYRADTSLAIGKITFIADSDVRMISLLKHLAQGTAKLRAQEDDSVCLYMRDVAFQACTSAYVGKKGRPCVRVKARRVCR